MELDYLEDLKKSRKIGDYSKHFMFDRFTKTEDKAKFSTIGFDELKTNAELKTISEQNNQQLELYQEILKCKNEGVPCSYGICSECEERQE
jgi:citrate lyase synthetase